MTLVLFDIDGTLILSGGVGRRALAWSGERLFGYRDLFHGVTFAGAIDPQIVGKGMAARAIPPTPRRIGRLRDTYLRELRRRIPGATGTVLPGVEAAVKATRERGSVGLLTGNWRVGAQVKLGHFGLWELFEPVLGAFGDDASERDALVPIAVRRARRRGIDVRRVLVVGDTPADVQCARAGQQALARWGVEILAVGVLTGWASREDLGAAGPDLLLDDLGRGLDRLLALVEG